MRAYYCPQCRMTHEPHPDCPAPVWPRIRVKAWRVPNEDSPSAEVAYDRSWVAALSRIFTVPAEITYAKSTAGFWPFDP